MADRTDIGVPKLAPMDNISTGEARNIINIIEALQRAQDTIKYLEDKIEELT